MGEVIGDGFGRGMGLALSTLLDVTIKYWVGVDHIQDMSTYYGLLPIMLQFHP
jgi:hypothetical protein